MSLTVRAMTSGTAAARALMRGRAHHAWCAIEPNPRPGSRRS